MKAKTKVNVVVVLIGIALAALVVGGDVLAAHYLYGDWTCAWKRCVEVVKP